MKKLFIFMCLMAVMFFTGCTDAQQAKLGGFGSPHSVEMYSGGKLIKTWTSSGKVQSTSDSDGYYFNDSKTGKLIEASGDIIITRL